MLVEPRLSGFEHFLLCLDLLGPELGIVEGLSVEPPDRGGRGRGQPAASRSPRVRSQVRRHEDKVIQAYVRGLTQRPGPRRGGRLVEPEAGHKIA